MKLLFNTHWNLTPSDTLGIISAENIEKAIRIMEAKTHHVKKFGEFTPVCGEYHLYFGGDSNASIYFARHDWQLSKEGEERKINVVHVPDMGRNWLLFDENHGDCIAGINPEDESHYLEYEDKRHGEIVHVI